MSTQGHFRNSLLNTDHLKTHYRMCPYLRANQYFLQFPLPQVSQPQLQSSELRVSQTQTNQILIPPTNSIRQTFNTPNHQPQTRPTHQTKPPQSTPIHQTLISHQPPPTTNNQAQNVLLHQNLLPLQPQHLRFLLSLSAMGPIHGAGMRITTNRE